MEWKYNDGGRSKYFSAKRVNDLQRARVVTVRPHIGVEKQVYHCRRLPIVCHRLRL